MADQIISLKIPDAKVAVALAGFLKIYPNYETILDPDWVEPDPNPDNEKQPRIPVYTNAQWVTEQIRRIIIRDVRRGLQMIATEGAQVPIDDGIAETV